MIKNELRGYDIILLVSSRIKVVRINVVVELDRQFDRMKTLQVAMVFLMMIGIESFYFLNL